MFFKNPGRKAGKLAYSIVMEESQAVKDSWATRSNSTIKDSSKVKDSSIAKQIDHQYADFRLMSFLDGLSFPIELHFII